MTTTRIHFVASQVESACKATALMQKRYGQCDVHDAEVIVALGGDGFMLRTLHRFIDRDLPVFGMKIGNIGFLMNRYGENDLIQRLADACPVSLNPLRMEVQTESGTETSALAINEISLLRQTNQAAHIRILVNDSVKVEDLVCDGVLLATAAGSTAYNFSVRGPILPLGTDALALTPISPFRPRRWNGAILPNSARVRFEVLDHYKRNVSATADAHEVRNVTSVDAFEDKETELKLLFDPDHSL
ncbi:MAG: NAD kinase, partial [Gammaproteobacteria bacterium]|nr:NAD kinase [Gammaproteobacteria bacterium]